MCRRLSSRPRYCIFWEAERDSLQYRHLDFVEGMFPRVCDIAYEQLDAAGILKDSNPDSFGDNGRKGKL